MISSADLRSDALQLHYERRLSHGTAANLSYTWAHSIDDLSSTFSDNLQGASGGIGNLGYLDPRNPGLDRGNSDFDIRHRLVVSPIYETPWFKQSGGWQNLLLGGYTFTSIFTARTGTPIRKR